MQRVILYIFFSVVVATKMTGFVNPAAPVIWILIATGLIYVARKLRKKSASRRINPALVIIGFIGVAYLTLQPEKIIVPRVDLSPVWAAKTHNTEVYRSLDTVQMPSNAIVLNCPVFEDVELMFWQDVTGHHWYPDQRAFDSLHTLNRPIYAFSNVEGQGLPEYIWQDTATTLLTMPLYSNPL